MNIIQMNDPNSSSNEIIEELWQVIPNQTTNNTTNCIMPKYLLNNYLRLRDIKLPLLFKVTNPQTNKYVICASDNFFDTEEGNKLAMLSPIVTQYLQIPDSSIVTIEMINRSPDLIPSKA